MSISIHVHAKKHAFKRARRERAARDQAQADHKKIGPKGLAAGAKRMFRKGPTEPQADRARKKKRLQSCALKNMSK
jgi:hypothetical protein